VVHWKINILCEETTQQKRMSGIAHQETTQQKRMSGIAVSF
jgi:hypothetical protein